MEKIYRMGGRGYLLEKLFTRKKIITYTNRIPVGTYQYDSERKYYGETFYLNFNKPLRILILGASGSGKSWLARSIISRAYFAGILPIIMTDVAPEYITSAFPLQEKFRKFLAKGEEPKPLPIQMFYPYFLYKEVGFESKLQQIFQFDISSILPTDLFAFIDYEKLGMGSRLELEDLIATLSKNKKKFDSIDDLIDYFQNKTTISTITKRILSKSLINLKELEVFGKNYPPLDIVNLINSDIVVDINLFGWQRLEFKKYVAVYLSLILRDIITAKQLKKIGNKKLLLVFEELHEFAPKKPTKWQEIIKREIETAVFTGRKEDISFIFITQSPETISPSVIEQCNYIFVPRGFERSKLMELVKNISPSLYTTPYNFGIEITNLMGSLRQWRDGAREWLVLERGGEIFKFTPFGPLNHHKEEGEVIE